MYLPKLVFLYAVAWSALPASAQTLALVVQRAIAQYPSVQAARAKVEAVRADIDKARSAHYPQLSLAASAGQYASGENPSGTSSVSPTARLNVWSGGRIAEEVQRAEALSRQTESQRWVTEDEVALAAAEAYVLWVRCVALARLAQANLQALQEVRDEISQVAAIDGGRRIEAEQASVRVDTAYMQLLQREAEMAQAQVKLQKFWDASLPVTPEDLQPPAATGAVWGQLPTSLEDARRYARDELPTLAAYRAAVEASRRGIAVAKGQYWPTVDLQANRQYNSSTGRYEDLMQLQLNMPVYSGGSTDAAVKAAVAQLQSAEFALDEARLNAREKIGIAWQDWQASQARIRAGLPQLQLAPRLVDGYRQQFRIARRSLLDVLNVQSEVNGYFVSHTNNVFDEYISRVRLLSAIGELSRRLAG